VIGNGAEPPPKKSGASRKKFLTARWERLPRNKKKSPGEKLIARFLFIRKSNP